ncbi:GNAT family N-acetyltransferase [Corynebacterium genitalium ATCC 33030]|uniref:Acetyltransferase, GNAT family n=1 Tax=Corynebacterium genitalium ATCC 33030 TaxID=585529 RepID=D7WAI2_9CORY|nr:MULTISPECIES: GNAT family N-acetyltransferase [Corynebacterium]EFK54863.1 acetyltransferase, GNAT family [Corynebacterium genitalium ATCC 33030]MCQ4617767.1 GNAT family N-acetyltransferase [Corynebacterium pseudogenitalium]MCQ4624188.1 GNAT family N-acetyltransferase [Corynebacterium sp. CCUG 69979]UUA89841.1 GNAT family N-acetyltransferase [Corynebacterium genitalium ATCC 33030]
MKFTLVPATESDRTYLRRLDYLADVFGDESHRRHGSVQSAEEYVGKWSPEHDGGFIAYDDELVPAGGVWLRYWKPGEDYSEANLGPDIPELAIAVENRSHGHRLGRILLQAACDLAAEHHARTIALHVEPGNDRARQVYEDFGFVQSDHHPEVMVKQL